MTADRSGGGIRAARFRAGRTPHTRRRNVRCSTQASEVGGAWLGKQRRETVRRNAPGGSGRDLWKPGHAPATRLPVDRETKRSGNAFADGDGPRAFSHRSLDAPASSDKHARSVSQQNAASAGRGAGADCRTLAVCGQQSEQQSASGCGCAAINADGVVAAGRGHRPLPAIASPGRQKASEANASQSR